MVGGSLYNQMESCYCDMIGPNTFDADRDPSGNLNISR